jgi:hypothetical protein
VITVAVRWYLRYGLSYRDLEELLAERGVEVDHVSVYRWVQRFTPPTAANPSEAHSGSPVLVDSNDRSRPARASAAVPEQDQDQTSVASQETTAPHRLPDRAAMIDPVGNILGLMYNPQYVDLLVSRG